MYIDPKLEVEKISILKIRDFCKKVGDLFGLDYICLRLKITKPKARKIINYLLDECYIEPADSYDNKQYWKLSNKGGTFALSSSAKPILRSTAERKVKEFLERVKIVNNDEYYLYKVTKVILFGSFLTHVEKLNDVDLAIELKRKNPDKEIQSQLEIQRAIEAEQKGRRFSTLLDKLCWAETEVQLFLKSKSRAISLHLASDPVLGLADKKVIYP